MVTLTNDQLMQLVEYARKATTLGLDMLLIDTTTPRVSSMHEDRVVGVFTTHMACDFPFQVMGLARLGVMLKLMNAIDLAATTATLQIHEATGNVQKISFVAKNGRKRTNIEFRCAKPDTILAIRARKTPMAYKLTIGEEDIKSLQSTLSLVENKADVLLCVDDSSLTVEVLVDNNDVVNLQVDCQVESLDGSTPSVTARYMRSVLTDLLRHTKTGEFIIDTRNIITTDVGDLDAFAIPVVK